MLSKQVNKKHLTIISMPFIMPLTPVTMAFSQMTITEKLLNLGSSQFSKSLLLLFSHDTEIC